jgi:putative ABC transport system substrate-binding protein
MRRRELITLVGGAAAALVPSMARAQQLAMPVIGFLHSADPRSFAGQLAAFHQGLKKAGFEDGHNLAIEYRWAEANADRLPAMAASLVQRKVDVIVAAGGNASNLAAKRATDTTPIVFTSGSDPIKLGLVTSLSRPGGNVTGVSFFTADLVAKQLGMLHQLIPAARIIAVLDNPTSPEAARQPEDARDAARKLGIEVSILRAGTDAEIDQAFAAAMQLHARALMVGSTAFFGSRVERIVGLAARHRIPDMHYRREFVAAGGLMSYGTSINDAYRQAGVYAGRILKGEKPADLPVLQSAKFEFVVNIKTAQALGIEIHPQLLATADEVIE